MLNQSDLARINVTRPHNDVLSMARPYTAVPTQRLDDESLLKALNTLLDCEKRSGTAKALDDLYVWKELNVFGGVFGGCVAYLYAIPNQLMKQH